MVTPAPPNGIRIDITGDVTGYGTETAPQTATGDLDATVVLQNKNWTFVGAEWTISDAPELGVATIDSTGQWTYTIDPAEFAALDPGDCVFDVFDVQITVYARNPGGHLRFETETQRVHVGIKVPCFVAGTLILAARGPVAVENLLVGDLVATRDHGLQPVRRIDRSHLAPERLEGAPELLPVRISRGALGPDVPRRDLLVSQQHRIMLGGARVELLFGAREVLVAAKSLCHLPGIAIVEPGDGIDYLHVLLDRHEILDAEGAPAESLFLGEETLHAMSPEGLQELAAIFGPDETGTGPAFAPAARPILRDREALALT
ncbi:Hint domain-containing protein [Sulfitobacter sp. LCG007]